MTARIVLFGATGYTGRLTAERLVARGERPLLAGRSEARLATAAERLGLDWRVADARRPGSLFGVVEPGDVLVSTVGPFVKWGDAAVRAAIAARAVYLDSTGEPAFIRRVAEELGPAAARAGATLMPATGFDYVPGALAGALALAEAGAEAERVDIGYFSLGAGPGMMSRGTAVSLAGAALEPMFAYRDGALRTVRAAERTSSFRVDGRDRTALSIGGAEHLWLPAGRPGLREVNVYAGDAGPAALGVQAVSALTAAVTRVPGVRTALRVGAEQIAALLPAPAPGTTPGATSWIAAAASDGGGRALAEVHLSGVNAYAFTAGFLAWAAARAAHAGVEPAGAIGPIEAFGLDLLARACDEAGLLRVRAPS